MNKQVIVAALAVYCVFATGSLLAAGRVAKIEPSASNVMLEGGKATVKFTVSGEAEESDNCGYWVEYGDGQSPDTRVISQREGLFPRSHERTFTQPGTYAVKARGQRVRTTLGCLGEAAATITVSAPPAAGKATAPAAKAAAVAPTCPEGWQLVKGSHNPNTGAFSCSVKLPEKKLACGPGLKYFEKGAVVGCRK